MGSILLFLKALSGDGIVSASPFTMKHYDHEANLETLVVFPFHSSSSCHDGILLCEKTGIGVFKREKKRSNKK